MYKYFPHTEADIEAMLAVIGAKSLDDLYAEVPEELLLTRPLALDESQSEMEVRAAIDRLAKMNRPLTVFAGAGAYDHYTPALVPYIAQRSEFSTSYTPYQAEISQGTLQYIFEYQSMMAALTGLDVSNASMYDGATATAEAMMMMTAEARKRRRVLVSATIDPVVLRVCHTYARFHGVDLVEVAERDGATDRQALLDLLAEDNAAGLIVAQPNRYGLVEDLTGLADACHAHKTLLALHAPASTLAVLKTPKAWGADIACGDAQSLGLPLGYGGPYIGYLCTTQRLVRKMPGRLVGATTDSRGQRAFVLTLQAREQHIRREKATSNICTAQGYMCLYVAAYLALMGPKGLREVNEQSYGAAHALREALIATGRFEDPFPQRPFLNEFTLRYKGDAAALRQRLATAGYLLGVETEGHPQCLTIAATEKNSPEQIAAIAALI